MFEYTLVEMGDGVNKIECNNIAEQRVSGLVDIWEPPFVLGVWHPLQLYNPPKPSDAVFVAPEFIEKCIDEYIATGVAVLYSETQKVILERGNFRIESI